MADIALVTADEVYVVRSDLQDTGVAGEAIVAGAPVRRNTTTGRLENGNGTTAPEARVIGIATRTVQAGEPLTYIRSGILDGYAITALAYDAPVYLSDTDGRLADAAGTVSLIVGRVQANEGVTVGTSADKVLVISFGI